MKEDIEKSWSFGKHFFDILGELRYRHFEELRNKNYNSVIQCLLDEADHIYNEITQDKDKRIIDKSINSLQSIEDKRITNKIRARNTLNHIRETRRLIWGLERKYKLDHPDVIFSKDKSDSVLDNR